MSTEKDRYYRLKADREQLELDRARGSTDERADRRPCCTGFFYGVLQLHSKLGWLMSQGWSAVFATLNVLMFFSWLKAYYTVVDTSVVPAVLHGLLGVTMVNQTMRWGSVSGFHVLISLFMISYSILVT